MELYILNKSYYPTIPFVKGVHIDDITALAGIETAAFPN